MKKNSNGNSFVEVILVVLFIGILTAIAVPRFSFSTVFKKTADTTAKKVVTDLRRTRRLAISNAAANKDGFELRIHANRLSYTITNLSDSSTVDNYAIEGNIQCTGGRIFQFGPLGNLITGSDTQVEFSSGDKAFTVAVVPATGMVKCVEN